MGWFGPGFAAAGNLRSVPGKLNERRDEKLFHAATELSLLETMRWGTCNFFNLLISNIYVAERRGLFGKF